MLRLCAAGSRRLTAATHAASVYAVAAMLAVGLSAAGCSNNRESAAARAPRDTGTGTATVASDGMQQIVVDGTEQFRFLPSTIKAKAGPLRIVLTNSGTTPHNLQVDGGTITGLVGSSEKSQITVNLTPGRHDIVCTLHTRLHMMGTIVVS